MNGTFAHWFAKKHFEDDDKCAARNIRVGDLMVRLYSYSECMGRSPHLT